MERSFLRKVEQRSWVDCKNEEMAITRKEEPNREKRVERDDSISRIKVLSIVRRFAPLKIYHLTPFNKIGTSPLCM